MSVPAIPDGYHSVTPYLIVDDAKAALDFYRDAFGAQELYRLPMPDGKGGEKIAHAEIRVGDSTLMLSDEWPDMGALGPKSRGGHTASFLIYVEDADARAAGRSSVTGRAMNRIRSSITARASPQNSAPDGSWK